MDSIFISEKAFAKLNLSLDVLGKRDDGYHEMLMIMQTISLHDNVEVLIRPGSGKIKVSTNRRYIPDNEKNLGYKAAQVFLESRDVRNVDVQISIEKEIPVCAGMAGGSSDAAAVLRAMYKAFELVPDSAEMLNMACAVGSDVPFCVCGGTAIARGRGTDIENLPDIFSCGIVIVKPYFSVSTPTLFSKIDGIRLMMHPDTDGMISALNEGSYEGVVRRVFNVFEDALGTKERNVVQGAKDSLLNEGASCASMTGTGSAVFGIFKSHDAAKAAYEKLSGEFRECFIARPVPMYKV